MKYILVISIGVLVLIVAFITNPKKDAYLSEVRRYTEKQNLVNYDGLLTKSFQEAVEHKIDEKTIYNNYWVFSTIRFNRKNNQRTFGFGLFNNVFLDLKLADFKSSDNKKGYSKEYDYSIKTNKVTFYLSNKGKIMAEQNNKEKVLVGQLKTRVENVEFSQYKDTLLLEIGENTFEGYFYQVYLIDLNNFDYWVFDKTCSNWEDFFYTKDNHLYYTCEYLFNNNIAYKLYMNLKKQMEVSVKNDQFQQLKKNKLDFEPATKL